VVVCDACGLRYTRPLPTPGELATLYGEEYYVNNKPRLASADFVRVLFERSVQWQHRRALLKRRPGRVLDVGCGNGEFLATLGARGWEVYGTEFSEAGCALARSKRITVHQGTLPSARFPDRFFDVVTLWHVLEHLPEPPVELAEIGRVLRDDGLLVVEVPNSDSLTFRLCGRRWYHLDLPRHLQHFTPTTLQRLLGQAGFAPSRRQDFHHWDFTASCYSFLARLGVLNRLGIHHFSTDYKQARPAAKAFFLALGLAVGLLCLPYSIAVTSLSRNGETVTVTARKVA
jgi:ubiquinone/menaquinone biosynthesis C-methylase UbiE